MDLVTASFWSRLSRWTVVLLEVIPRHTGRACHFSMSDVHAASMPLPSSLLFTKAHRAACARCGGPSECVNAPLPISSFFISSFFIISSFLVWWLLGRCRKSKRRSACIHREPGPQMMGQSEHNVGKAGACEVTAVCVGTCTSTAALDPVSYRPFYDRRECLQ